MNYLLADYVLDLKGRFPRLEKMCSDYAVENQNPIAEFEVTDEDLAHEAEKSEAKYSNFYLETIAMYRKIAEWLPLHNAFLLHSAVYDVNGVGIALAAHSGTGKTTHMRLWQQLLGDEFKIVNGDKPIIRFFDGEPNTPYAYGTPWNGKEHLGCNMKTKLQHICFIERAEVNSCTPMEPKEAIDLIFNQVYMPKNPMAVMNTIQLINRFIYDCKLWKIRCNMDISAAEVAYKTIFNQVG